MLDGIREDGQPYEEKWPYSQSPPDINNWEPPLDVYPLYARNGTTYNGDVAWLIDVLDQGSPVIVLMTLSASFYVQHPDALIDEAPNEKPDPTRRHAVIAAGHGKSGADRAILIRNSWGPSWGETGYAWVTERYLAPRMFGAARLLEDVSVSSSPNTA